MSTKEYSLYDNSGAYFFGGRVTPENAVHRPEEDELLAMVEAGDAVFVDALRRSGKTTMVMNAFAKDDRPVFRIDLFNVRSTNKLIERIDAGAKHFLTEYPAAREKLCSSYELNAELGYSLLNVLSAKLGGRKTVDSLGPRQSLDAVLGLVAETAKTVNGVVFVDEFQAVKDVENPAETIGSFSAVSDPAAGNDVPFVYAGSNRYAMHQIFSGTESLFYQRCKNLPLGPLPPKSILPFLEERFGAVIEKGVGEAAYEWTHGITGDLQRVFSAMKRIVGDRDVCRMPDFEKAKEVVVNDLGRSYKQTLHKLSDRSLNLLDRITESNAPTVEKLSEVAAEAGMANIDIVGGVEELAKLGLIHLPIPEYTIERPEPIFFHYLNTMPAIKHRPFGRPRESAQLSLSTPAVWPTEIDAYKLPASRNEY